MPDEEPINRPKQDEDAPLEMPDLPSLPTLPDAPTLKPNLPSRSKPKNESAKDYQQMGIAYTIPALLITPIVLLTVGGWWLDTHYHKSPAFTLGGALLGTVCGFINMFRAVSKLNK